MNLEKNTWVSQPIVAQILTAGQSQKHRPRTLMFGLPAGPER